MLHSSRFMRVQECVCLFFLFLLVSVYLIYPIHSYDTGTFYFQDIERFLSHFQHTGWNESQPHQLNCYWMIKTDVTTEIRMEQKQFKRKSFVMEWKYFCKVCLLVTLPPFIASSLTNTIERKATILFFSVHSLWCVHQWWKIRELWDGNMLKSKRTMLANGGSESSGMVPLQFGWLFWPRSVSHGNR